MVKISVIVPVYNVEKYLKECLDSVLTQSFTDFEVICVDDGSTDSSSTILHQYKGMDHRIHVIRQENSGLSIARNTGIEHARGEFICFLDSDDMLCENSLAELWDSVEYDTDIVCFDAKLEFEQKCERLKTSRERYYSVTNEYKTPISGRELFCQRVENDEYVDAVWLLFIRRKWLEEKRFVFLPGALYEDSVFAMQCFFACSIIKYLQRRLYIYRVRNDSIMTQAPSFQNVYFRIWQSLECIHYSFSVANNVREKNALIKQSDFYMRCALDAWYELDRNERKKIFDDSVINMRLYRFLLMDCIRQYDGSEFGIDSFFESVEKSKGIVIYGSGNIGKKVMKILNLKGMSNKIVGFAVSDSLMEDNIDGIPIKKISEYSHNNGLLVIIAAGEWAHAKMISIIRKYGFRLYFPVSYTLEKEIDRETSYEQ